MNRWLKIAGLGIVTWAVPFILSIPLLPLMTSDQLFFKTIMVVSGSLTGMAALVYYLKDIKKDALKESAILAAAWLAINWLLDFLILLPLSQQSLPRYFMEIGLEYLSLPIMALGAGYLLQKKK